jgi:phosphatidate cytidylyltransferase
MLSTRIWMGSLLIGLVVAVLLLDHNLAPWYPFLFVLFLMLTLTACRELLSLLNVERRPDPWFCYGAALLIILANWPANLKTVLPQLTAELDAWHLLLGAFLVVVQSAFLLGMATFEKPGSAVTRIAMAIWIVAYLCLIPSFLIQLRWLPDRSGEVSRGVSALVLAIFVPKCCDIGAYFTGRFLGRSPMTPLLSPKKTLEGLGGGLALAVLAAVALNRWLPALTGGDLAAVGFGITVGLAAALGDLAESFVKRDCQQKDASQVVPGFGGVLDVVDSIIFASPLAYCWLRLG